MALSMNVLEMLQAPTPSHTLTLIGCYISYKLIQNLAIMAHASYRLNQPPLSKKKTSQKTWQLLKYSSNLYVKVWLRV